MNLSVYKMTRLIIISFISVSCGIFMANRTIETYGLITGGILLGTLTLLLIAFMVLMDRL